MNTAVTISLVAFASLATVRVAAWQGALVVHTPSVPMGLYWRHELPLGGPARGAYVCVDAISPEAPAVLRDGVLSGWLPSDWRSQVLVKRVAAVPGQRVAYVEGQGVMVDNELLRASRPQSADSHGTPLPQPSYPVDLQGGQVWLSSEHGRGFDSRYFGAVNVGALSCVAEPLWTF